VSQTDASSCQPVALATIARIHEMVSGHTDARPWRDRAKLLGCRNRVYEAQRPGAENGVVGRDS
jgi:hypothetical protein